MSPLATWTGPYTAITPTGAIEYGDEHDVTENDLLSAHWTPVRPARKNARPAAETTEPDQEGTD